MELRLEALQILSHRLRRSLQGALSVATDFNVRVLKVEASGSQILPKTKGFIAGALIKAAKSRQRHSKLKIRLETPFLGRQARPPLPTSKNSHNR